VIRDATPGDLAAILRLNKEWEHVTSPLDEGSLAELYGESSYCRVMEAEGEVVAFILALSPGAAYDSPNYRWFDARGGDFLYIDRVVVGAASQRAGFGAALYDDLLEFASRQGVSQLVCEVDIEPLNVSSDAFHASRGFVEVGTQPVAGGRKRVSLRERVLC